MQFKYKLFTVGAVFFAFSLIVGMGLFSNISFKDKIYDTWEVRNTNYKVKITAFGEVGVIPPGSYFVIESTATDSEKWRKIITVESDGNPLIPRNQVRFVSERIGYIFISSFYLVTTDGGENWVIWDAEKALPTEKYIRDYNLSPYIEEIEINPDGTGRLKFLKQVKQYETGPELVTTDYGINWELSS